MNKKVFAPADPTSLADWLAYLEGLHPSTIELGLERVGSVAERLALKLDCVTFVVGGTNGKGSTCTMLAAILAAAGYRVGVYTSPHLCRFNERACINGHAVTDAQLVAQFQEVERARGAVSLTYFEFTTLAILRLFAQASLDAVVLEIGLGGRLDAVNLIDADCAVITSVDIDHTDWLGKDRESIGLEKAHIYRPGRPAICADPRPPQSLLDHAQKIGADLWRFGVDFNYAGDRQQWSYGGRMQRRNALAYPALRGANQLLNASAALAALEALRDRLPVPQQAVRQGLLQVTLPGRFQILPGQPLVVLDVAHNPHAAAVLAQNLGVMGYYPYTHAVFGMLSDKDVAAVVAKFRGLIDHWYCATLDGARGLDGQTLASCVRAACVSDLPQADAPGVHVCDSVAQAWSRARAAAGEGDRIVVFGSFHTVAAVLALSEHTA